MPLPADALSFSLGDLLLQVFLSVVVPVVVTVIGWLWIRNTGHMDGQVAEIKRSVESNKKAAEEQCESNKKAATQQCKDLRTELRGEMGKIDAEAMARSVSTNRDLGELRTYVHEQTVRHRDIDEIKAGMDQIRVQLGSQHSDLVNLLKAVLQQDPRQPSSSQT